MWKIYRSCRAGRILFCQTSTRPLTKCGKVGQTQEKVVKEKSCEELVVESCLILCNNTDCSLPGTTVHRISEARMLESRLPFPSGGALPNPGIEPEFPSLQADSLPSEPPGKPPF